VSAARIGRAGRNLSAFGRYIRGLPRFLRTPVEPDDAIGRVARGLADREHSFLRIAERAIYANPTSPYRRLLEHAGAELGDLRGLVSDRGLEGALESLRTAGVFVRLEELRGVAPLRRSGLEITAHPDDFANPLLVRDFETGSGGSGGAARRIAVDFDLFAYEAGHTALFLRAFGLGGRPLGIWSPVPPGHAAMNNVLRHAKLGRPHDRWFSHYRSGPRAASVKYAAFTGYAVWGSRLVGRPLPRPEYTPLEQATRVARWLAAWSARGTPAVLETNVSSGVRVCLAALDDGLDISGSFLRLGGEPFTEAKAAIIDRAGVRAACHYSMGEVGRIGGACAHPAALDDCHLLTDKVAAIQHRRPVAGSPQDVPALLLTNLHPSAPRLLLNAEIDDYAQLEQRSCGCTIGGLGLTTHIHSIRSYEKLTTEGMNFLGPNLISLVDDVLPARFGGAPTDYQLAEREEGGLPAIEVVIAPRVGDLPEPEVMSTVLGFLGRCGDGERMMVDRWAQAGTLRVARREPAATVAAKVLPLHLTDAAPR
jgi:hypothetical protein